MLSQPQCRIVSKTLHAVTNRDDKRRQHIKDVIDEEKDIRRDASCLRLLEASWKISICL
jgi:hypothetical protein